MKQEIINGGNARYLGELERFKDGIPFGIVNKTKTDVGGTYVAANCSSNYIIVCPFKDLVDSICLLYTSTLFTDATISWSQGCGVLSS